MTLTDLPSASGSISGLLLKRATANSGGGGGGGGLDIPGAARGTRVLQFDKKIRNAPHFLQSSFTSDRQRAPVKRKNVCKSNGVTRKRERDFFCHLVNVSIFFSVRGSTLLFLGYVELWSFLFLFLLFLSYTSPF